MSTLFSSYKLGNLTLKNRIVMAPMTRSRSIGNVPGDIVVKYYEQRAGAGLIITEGTSPSPNGLGYARIPGIFSEEQVKAWHKVTDAVHAKGGAIFVQLMHTGRVGHPLNLPAGATLVAPSAIAPAGDMYTDQEGMQPNATPKAMTAEDLEHAKNEFVEASKNAIKAGFDGVELHGANGYLLDQFLNPAINQRTDEYGGSIEKRAKYVLEVASAAASAIGADKVGIRLSPYGTNADTHPYEEIEATYAYLAKELGTLGLAYVHVVDHSAMGAPKVTDSVKAAIRTNFKGTYILSGGYDKTHAEADLTANKGELVAFGRPYLNNPDLAERLQNNWPLNPDLDFNTFYTPGEKGYTDYATHSA